MAFGGSGFAVSGFADSDLLLPSTNVGTVETTAKGAAEVATGTQSQLGTASGTAKAGAEAAVGVQGPNTGSIATTAKGAAEATTGVQGPNTGTIAGTAKGGAEAAAGIEGPNTGTVATGGPAGAEAASGATGNTGSIATTAKGAAEAAAGTEGPNAGTIAMTGRAGAEAAAGVQGPNVGAVATTAKGGDEAAAGAQGPNVGAASSQTAAGDEQAVGTMVSPPNIGTVALTATGAREQATGTPVAPPPLPPVVTVPVAYGAFRQDITIFSPDDDDVPLIGTVDGAGNIVEPSFSTDGTHPRPWLKPILSLGGAQADFRDGSSTIDQLTVEVLDKRQVATDQTSGLFTYLAATADGDTALLGVRIVVRELAPDGVTMQVVLNGVIQKVSLNTGTFVGYPLLLRDIRERERVTRLFPSASSSCVFPRIGPADGYGYHAQWDNAQQKLVKAGEPVVPMIDGIRCAYLPVTADGGLAVPWDQMFELGQTDATKELKQLWDSIGDVWLEYGTAQQMLNTQTGIVDRGGFYFPFVIVDYSTVSAKGPWVSVVAPPVVYNTDPSATTAPNLFGEQIRQGESTLGRIQIAIPAGQPALTRGQQLWVRVRSNREPTPDVPLWIEGPAGDILRDISDGVYSPSGLPPGLDYSEAGMVAFTRRSPWLIAKVTQSETDPGAARDWVRENIYRIMGEAPVIDEGFISPVSGDLPDESVVLPILDDTVIYGGKADWEHTADNVVNRVDFSYERDIVPLSNTGKLAGTIATQQVSITRERVASLARHGAKPITFQPISVRAVVPLPPHTPLTADTTHDTGTILGMARAESFLRRYPNGAATAWAECRASLTWHLKVGDWVIMAASWLPDYKTRKRGINRMMQILKVEKPARHVRRFTLSDAGPLDQPVARPTVGAIVDNGDGTLTVPITAFPAGLSASTRYRADVQFALGETEPAVDSGAWISLPPLDAPGNVQTGLIPSGALVWIRVRGVGDGVRSSSYTVAVSHRMAASPTLRTTTVTIEPYTDAVNGGKPRVSWNRLLTAAGVRVSWEVYNDGDDEPAVLTHAADYDAALGVVDLPVVLKQRQWVVVQVTPYTGFAAGAVAGVAGDDSRAAPVQRLDDPYVMPMVAEELTRDADTATLTLVPDDPQAQITRILVRTRTGDAGAWTAWVEDTNPPYGATVSLVEGESSAIDYQVYALDADGVERLTQGAPREFGLAPVVGGVESMMLVSIHQNPATTSDTVEGFTVEALAPDGTRGNIILVEVGGGATLASGPSIGVSTPDGGTGIAFTFNRNAKESLAVFRAVKSGFQSDDDSTKIAALDKDTKGLLVTLKPVTSTNPAEVWADLLVTDPNGNTSPALVTLTFQGMPTIGIPGNPAAGTGSTINAVPGTSYRITLPMPAFGSPAARLSVVGTKSGLLSDADMVDVAPQGRDTVMPSLIEAASETATLGTLVLTPVDPQARLTMVEFRTYTGTALVQDWTAVAKVGGVYTQTVPLVEQQTSRIEYRWRAIPVGGGAAILVDGKSVRYGIGARPLPPVVSWDVTPDGVLKVTSSGDSSTNQNRIIIAIDAPPSQDALEGAVGVPATTAVSGPIDGRSGVFVYPTNLLPGQRFFILAASYNTALGGSVRNQSSSPTGDAGQWIGPTTSQAKVSVTSVSAGPKSITLNGVTLTAQAGHVDIFVREYRADPGNPVDVSRSGYKLATLTESGSPVVPVSNPLNFLLITLKAVDALNRTGADTVSTTGALGNTVNLKVQAAAGTVVPPNPPLGLAGIVSGTSSDLSITNAGSNLPDTFRIYRNGAFLVDVPVTVAANAVQHYLDPGRTPGSYEYKVYSVKAGVVSSAFAGPVTVTFTGAKIPTPTLAVGAYNQSTQSFPVTITPGAGTPADVVWQLEHNTQSSDGFGNYDPFNPANWANAEQQTVTSFPHSHGASSVAKIDNFRVTGSKAGYPTSDPSATVAVALPKWQGNF